MSRSDSSTLACARAFALAILAIVIPASTSIAQRPDSLPAGSRLRVTTPIVPGGQVTGVLGSADSTAMSLLRRSYMPLLIPYSEIESVAIARGRERSPGGAARGAVRGLIVGATVGIVATSIAYYHDVKDPSVVPASVVAGVMSIGFAAVTTGIGALIGSAPRTRWEPVWPR